MERRSPGLALPALLALLSLAAPLAVVLVLRALPPSNLEAAGIGWVADLLAGGVLIAAAAATIASLVAGLRNGSLAVLLLGGSCAALAGGSVGLIAGVGSMSLAVTFAALLMLAAALAERLELLVGGRGPRIAAAAVLLLAAEAVAVAEIAPAVYAALSPLAPATIVVGAGLAALATLIAAGRPMWAASAALAVGAASLALARAESAELVVGIVALIGASLLTARAALGADGREATAPGTSAGAELTLPLWDGVLRFDGRLRLRSWNASAAALLSLDDASAGVRLEDLLGVPLSLLPGADETISLRTPSGDLDAAIQRAGDTIVVVIRDAEVSSDADRLGRELRGTLEELLEARRTIELQRQEIDRAATVDPLTGVASRSSVIGRLAVEVAQARRYEHPVAAVLIDIDEFGRINGEHGVAGGDALLREVALRVRLRVRDADALGRLGSDGFLAVLPHTDEVGAASFGDALRWRIAQRPIAVGGAQVQATVSIGVAVMRPGEDLDLDGLLARAAEALASAQSAGGNRIALDRLHGLARLEPRPAPGPDEASAPDSGAGTDGA